MLSIAKMGAGQELYYTALAAENYYLAGGEPLGQWWGRGADKLGLRGKVEDEELGATLRGFGRDGIGLVQNAGRDNRRPGWDLTFSCPKSVSVLWSQAEPEIRQEIQAAHKIACMAALSYLESVAGYSRTGKGGYEQRSAGLAVAMFEHGTSRALDPDFHTHCLVANLGVSDDGRTRTIDSRHLFRHKMAAGALYRVELASELERRLGLETERKRTWFELKGVPKSLCDFFSKRRQEILDAMGKLGLETASAAAVATLATRKTKEPLPPRAELFDRWRAPGREHGFSTEEAKSLLGHKKQVDRRVAYRDAIEEGIKTLTDSESHFARRDIVRRVMEASQGRGLDASHVLDWLHHDLEQSGQFVKLAERDGEMRYTTPEMLATEKRILESAESWKRDRRSVVSSTMVDRVLNKNRGNNGTFALNAEQTRAVRHLTESPGRVQILSGLAGTGKTSTLRVCREAWESAGYSVIGAALAGKASEELHQGAAIESYTLKRLAMMMHPSIAYQMKHHAKQLLRAAKKAPTWKLKSLRFNEQTVLVIDEAAMVGTRQMARVMGDVLAQGGKIVLVGDASQLQAIEAGCPFFSLAKRLGAVKLVDITRQRSEEDRSVVRDVLRGDAQKALEALARRDRLQVASSRAKAMDDLVSRWTNENRNGLKNVLALAATHQEVDELNQRLQRSRIFSGHVKSNKTLKLQNDFVFIGDRVLFKANSYELGVRNGHLGTVTGISQITKTIAVTLDDGNRVVVSLPRYHHARGEKKGQIALELGYAATTHAAQGTTLEDAYLLLGGSMQDRQMSYVQFSRARGKTFAFIDEHSAGENLKEISAAMTRSRTKDLAHDVLLDSGLRQQILR